MHSWGWAQAEMSFPVNVMKVTVLLSCCVPGRPLQCSAQTPSRDRSVPMVNSGSGGSLDDARGAIAASDFERAKMQLESYLSVEPNSADGRFLLAYTLLRLNNPKASLAEYTQAAQLRSPSGQDLRYVAEDYAVLNDYADAERWMQKSLQMNARDPDTWYGLGRIQYTLQKFPAAVESFEKALALAPRSVKIEDNLALVYEDLNREEDAVAAYRTALDWQRGSEHPSEQPMLNLAIILIRKGGLEEAERLLLQAVAIAPKDAKIREQLGHLYLQREQYIKAQPEFEQAVILEPDNASFHFLLGRVYQREGMKDKADIEFARAAELNGRRSSSGGP